MTVEITRATASDRDMALAILLDAAARQARHQTFAWSADELAETVDGALQHDELYLARRNNGVVGVFVLQWADPFYWGERPDDADNLRLNAYYRDAGFLLRGTLLRPDGLRMSLYEKPIE